MAAMATQDWKDVIGRAPDRLPLAERIRLIGKYVALELYTPEATPLVQIEAIGDSLADCIRMLKSRGLDPKLFEFKRLTPPLY
jgi:hypothetical protein